MNRRTAKMAATFLVGVMAAVIMPIAFLGAPASADTEQFSFNLVTGELVLRGAEPYALQNPTTLAGTNTDGQLSGIDFDTPVVSTVREVPEFNTTAAIDATFSLIEPGTGSINEQGGMTVQLKLAVDLHIVVPLLPEPADCRSEPINLTLSSTVPYNEETDQVTLRAPNFTVPPVPSSDTCIGVLAGPVNDALAGPGHALTLTMAGEITPPEVGEPTVTTLSASPTGSTEFGDPVTLSATVVPEVPVEGAPPITGVVNFFDDGQLLGSANVAEDGTATLETSDLPAGPAELTAAYSGAPPDWEPSETVEVLDHVVIADPLVSSTAAGEVRVGGAGKDFDVTVLNTGFGDALDDARLEVKINRQTGTGPIGPNGANPRITLSRVVDGTPTAIPLTFVPSPTPASLNGVVGDADTWDLGPAEEHTENLRLQVAAGVAVGPLSLTFTLVTGEGETREVLGTTSSVITMVNEARTNATVVAGNPGFPPGGIPAILPITPVVRQGGVAEMRSLGVNPAVSGVFATGTFSFSIDGVPVLAQHTDPNKPNAFSWQTSVSKATNAGNFLLKVPTTIPTGVRTVTVRYSGDGLFTPAQANFPVTIEPSTGTVYECAGIGVGTQQTRFTANVEVQATLPQVWAAGQDVPVDRVQVRMRLSRTAAQEQVLNDVLDPAAVRTLELGLSNEATITPATVTSSNETVPTTGDALPPDRLIDLTGGTGMIPVSDTPGEARPFDLETITISATDGGFATGFECTPDAQAYRVGTITAAGTTLTVEPGEVVSGDTSVTLRATALPVAAGVVEFRSGTTTVGVAPVNPQGVAQVITNDLPGGQNSLTARFYGGPVATNPSAAVPLLVVETCSSETPVEQGNGAAVRLVYMELLRRCPDAAGYAYWKGQLDSGAVTREGFANQISTTKEARMVIVDDGYRQMLERPAEQSGKEYWAGLLANGAGYDDLLAALASSGNEYSDLAGGTIEGYVIRSYEQILERTPSEGEVDFWVGFIERRGTSGKKALILSFFGSEETLGTLVTRAYQELLDREPTSQELADGIELIKGNVNRSALYASVIDQDEFFERAQGFPELVV